MKNSKHNLCSYALYSDCQKWGINYIPWIWGETWVKMNHGYEYQIIGLVRNTPDGIIISIYKKIEQNHIYHNIILSAEPFLFHVFLENIHSYEYKKPQYRIDLLISWDSSILFMNKKNRILFWENLGGIISITGRIIMSFIIFESMSKRSIVFMNSQIFKNSNHHFRGNFDIEDTSGFNLLNNKLISSGVAKCLKNKNGTDKIFLKYFDVVDSNSFSNKVDAIKYLSNVKVSYFGFKIQL